MKIAKTQGRPRKFEESQFIQFCIDAKMKERLGDIAKQEGAPMGSLIRYAINRLILDHKPGKIQFNEY